ncbi:MAG: Proline--tRNA ligase [Chlamydiia bacterium]|nr:Proline--tRNA ligase [Chlamydiia bacterium]MCH9615010.1 Proline--tRNA ligase [Chlamydiia bacterium]MCH9629940.1 Proline--tRNA ligase [Chlamydiia bacterium]
MSKKLKTAINPTREEDFPEWYQQVIKASDLAEHSPVRGCMVIKPWGYRIWEKMQKHLDDRFREKGSENAYFPLFIPLSYLQKEANHVEGFATECAVVTHHRLEKDGDGQLQPSGELEEPLIVRPTSEMIIGESFSRWIESYRDLPLKINQWANVVRWEMRTRLFLRTAEFLWQEGHTAHATEEEANACAREMHRVYIDFLQDVLAIPVVAGEKTEAERFPGAVSTYTFEAMMQDGKALQGGTSHFLGQNFSKAQDITFTDQDGQLTHAWTTSWGVTTRMIGAMVMVHSDDDGLILPPRIASSHIVIIPICHKEELLDDVHTYANHVAEKLRSVNYHGAPLDVKVDTRDMRGGEKSWDWIKKGVPLRIEIGPREMEEKQVSVKTRTNGHKEREDLILDDLLLTLPQRLDKIQDTLYERALFNREQKTREITNKDDFYAYFNEGGGFAYAHWCGDAEVEEQVKKDLQVTIRCIPDEASEPGTCIFTGKPSAQTVLFAKAY